MRFLKFVAAAWLVLGCSLPSAQAGDDDTREFVTVTAGAISDAWAGMFSQLGGTYSKPVVAFYTEATPAACGGRALAAMGPFYCPEDRTILVDPAFFHAIAERSAGCGAGADACRFAQAWVLAHLAGHHVQNLLGILPSVRQRQQGLDRAGADELQVRLELQADCFAGLWAKRENERLQTEGKGAIAPADIEAAMQTAAAIGGDMLQRRADRAVPDSFTHGTAEERSAWISTGYREGSPSTCNTFFRTSPTGPR